MKHFIVIQIIVISEINKGIDKEVVIQSIVRRLKADSKETAIGKFVVATQDIKALKKLDIECYDLSELKSID